MEQDIEERTDKDKLYDYETAIKLLFDWCGYNFAKPNTVIAHGVKDIMAGKNNSEKAVQAGVLTRQKVAERNRRIVT